MAYFHYTSRKASQDIICGVPSCLRPGPSGKIYLSPTAYDFGHQAAGELAILKEVEVACEIPENRPISPSQPTRARQIKNPDGSVARMGGGFELTTSDDVLVNGVRWVFLNQP